MKSDVRHDTFRNHSQILHDAHSTSISSRARLSQSLSQRIRNGAKDLIHFESLQARSKKKTPIKKEQDHILSDPAFNSIREQDSNPTTGQHSSNHAIIDNLRDVADATANPRRGLIGKATKVIAGKIGSNHRSPINIDHDQEYLKAHDKLAEELVNSSSPATSHHRKQESGLKLTQERFREVENQRQSLQAAWVLGRYVDRVKVVPSLRAKPDIKFVTRQGTRFEWENYLGYLALYYTQGFILRHVDEFDAAPFNAEALARVVERLAITSAPWQAFFVDLRKIYMWKDPLRTSRWALTFWTLWYTEHLVGCFYGLIIYSTLYNRFHTGSVESTRRSVRRRQDREAQAMAWGELIQQHGKQDWIEPLVRDLGPIIQRQLGDLANFLEIMFNFYQHENSSKTAATVFFFSICFLITFLADMAFCMKIVWFVIGGSFFFSFPLATKYPEYRIVVSVLRWIFWDIPTHAELAIIRLQERAASNDIVRSNQFHDSQNFGNNDYNETLTDESYATPNSIPSPNSSPDSDADSNPDLCCGKVTPERYRFSLRNGKLLINRSGIEYRPSIRKRTAIATKLNPTSPSNPNPNDDSNQDFDFTNLIEIQKLNRDDSYPFLDKLGTFPQKVKPSSVYPSTASQSGPGSGPGSNSGLGLRFRWQNKNNDNWQRQKQYQGEELEVYPCHPSDRDRIFNLVLAWSGRKWRVL